MNYIGNIPEFNIVHSDMDRFDYVNSNNPAVDTNPSTLYSTWLNSTTGETFICTSNTVGINVWSGSSGRLVIKEPEDPFFVQGVFDGTKVLDTSGNNRHISLVGAVDMSTDVSGALRLTDSPNTTGTESSFSFLDVTASFWCLSLSATSDPRFISIGVWWDDGDYLFTLSAGNISFATMVPTQHWDSKLYNPIGLIHVVGVRDAVLGESRFYVNGVLEATQTDLSTTSTLNGKLLIQNKGCLAVLADLRFYDRALSITEITTLYRLRKNYVGSL